MRRRQKTSRRTLTRIAIYLLIVAGLPVTSIFLPANLVRAASPTITAFPIPTVGALPLGIAAGPDGALWFTEFSANMIGRITTSGAITEFPIPTPNSGPREIAAGPDGALWFTENGANQIGRITLSGSVAEFPIPTANSCPIDIVAGPDGALWFTEFCANQIGRITTSGGMTEFPLPTAPGAPYGITVGPDGALWFAQFYASQIGRITTSGAITEFPVPLAGNYNIAAGPDGALWFTSKGEIGRITTSGSATQFSTGEGSVSASITAGPDGALWSTEAGSNQIGRITTSGSITRFPIPTANSSPEDIATGPDGALWFPEANPDANQIGRIFPATAPPASLPSVVLPPSVLHVDDVISHSQPIGAFLDTSNTSGLSSTFYSASVLYFLGDSLHPAYVLSASTTGRACPAALNDPSNFDCFFVFPANDFAYQRSGTYSLSIFVASTTGAIGLAFANVGVVPAHYSVQMKAWIPFPIVVDPLNPTGLSGGPAITLGWPTCGMPGGLADHLTIVPTTVLSNLLGDSHQFYDGTFRVESSANFDWDGVSITNFQPEVTASISNRSITYTVAGHKSYSCIMSAQATAGMTSRLLAPTSFGLDYSSATPLVPLAPAISGSVQGTFRPDGTIDFGFVTGGFPTHGVEVARDGKIQQIDLLNDVSCISQADVLGLVGAQNVLRGLNGNVTSTNSFTDSPTQVGTGGFIQHSGLC